MAHHWLAETQQGTDFLGAVPEPGYPTVWRVLAATQIWVVPLAVLPHQQSLTVFLHQPHPRPGPEEAVVRPVEVAAWDAFPRLQATESARSMNQAFDPHLGRCQLPMARSLMICPEQRIKASRLVGKGSES